MTQKPILDDEDLNTINEALGVIDDTEEDVNRAELAGIDVTEIKRRREAAKNKLLAMRRAFFPNSSK